MPDVGTLNLTIESNANVAASGLDKLADALSRVQQAVGTGLKLSNASRSLNSFAKAVSENSKALSNVGTFLTAITNYTKAFKDAEKVKFNAKPIEDLKNAIGEGIKIGQAGTQINKLREALGGDWNIDNAKKAGDAMALIAEGAKTFVGTNLGSIAKNVSAVGKALGEYAEGAAKVRDVVGEQKWNKNQGMSELEDAAKMQKDWFDAGGFSTGKKMPLNLQQFGRRSSKDNVVQTNIAPGQYDLTAQKLITVQEAIAQSTSAGAQFYAVISEIADVVETRIIPRFREMYQIWSMLSYQQNAFAMEGARLMSGNSPLLLGDGRTPGQLLLGDGSEPETFLSVWRDTGEQWKQNWVFFASEAADEMRAYFQPDWIVGGQAVPQSMSTFHLGAGDNQLLLGDGGVSPENMLSTMVDYTEQWKQDWIVVEGTVSDVTESINEQAVAVENLTDAVRENKREAAQKVQDTYGYGSLENMFNGIRRGMKVENDLLSRFLHGEGTKNEQLYALKTASGLFGMPIDEVRQKVMELREAESGATPAAEQLSEALEQVGESAQGLQSAATAIEDIKTGIIDSSKVTAWLSKEVDNVKQGFANLAGSKLLKQFFGRAKMMAMRAAIRAISSAFQEGIENLYRYSQATGTGFAPAMDEASTALLHMKNSIAAAVSPLIQSLIPVLKSVTSAVITAVNYLNQFFALLRGQSTWTEAIEYSTQAYDDNTNAAQGAAKAAKDLLADWDELNIIQSEGGGGGGGRLQKEQPDYASMFEEVNKFDDKIREIVDFIEKHLGGLKTLLKKLGALLLAWKFSKAFRGIIGKLGEIIAGGILVDLGISLSYGSGLEAGKKGYFDVKDIIGAIGGAIATGIGGSLITKALGLGSGVGFAIGIGAAIIATLYGYIEGQELARDARKWGNLKLTKEQIDQFVKKQFTFDVETFISVVDGHITVEKEARTNLDNSIAQFRESFEEAKINVTLGVEKDITAASIKTAATDAQTAINNIEALVKAQNNGLQYMLKEFKIVDSEGNDMSAAIMKDVNLADETLTTYFSDIGKKLAQLILEGEKSGWKNGEAEQALALMESQKRIFDRAAEIEEEMKTHQAIKEGMGDLIKDGVFDQDTAMKVMERQEELLSEVKQKTIEQQNTLAENYRYLASLAQAAAEEAGLDTEAGQKLQAAADTYTKRYEDTIGGIGKAVEDKLDKTKENIRKQWIETLIAVYGEDYKKKIEENTSLTGKNIFGATTDLFGNEIKSTFRESLEHASKQGEAGKFLREWVEAEFGLNDPNNFATQIQEKFGLNFWDLMTEDMRNTFFSNTAAVLGNEKKAAEAFMSAFGLSEDGLSDYMKNYKKKAKKEVNETKEAVKETVNEATEESVAPLSWLARLLGLEYQPPTDAELQEIQKNIDIGKSIPVDTKVDTVVDENQVVESVQTAVEDALEDKTISVTANVQANTNWSRSDQGGAFGATPIDNGGARDSRDMRPSYMRGMGYKKAEEAMQDAAEKVEEVMEPIGRYGKGTIDLFDRPVIVNPDGTISTEESFSIGVDGKQVLIPQIVDGVRLGVQEAENHYFETLENGKPEHLGIFDTVEEANSYAKQLHNRLDEVKEDGTPYIANINGMRTLLDSTIDGVAVSFEEAVQQYLATGKHLGQYNTYDEAEEAAKNYTAGMEEVKDVTREAVHELDDLYAELMTLINADTTLFDIAPYFQEAFSLFDGNNVEGMKRLIDYIKEFGVDKGFKKFQEGDETGNGTNMLNRAGNTPLTRVLEQGGYVVGAMGKSDVSFGSSQTTTEQKTEPVVDYNQMANSVQQGTTMANNPMVSQLGSIIDQLTRLLNKQWVVNVEPTTTFGRTVNQSQTAYGNVTGDAPIFG